MEKQLDIFNTTIDPLDKNFLKNRLNTTEFTDGHPGFAIIEWAEGDESLAIRYQVRDTPFGKLLVASTEKGIVYIGFNRSSRISALEDLKKRFPGNEILDAGNDYIDQAMIKLKDPASKVQLPLHLKGTAYQLAIWKRLLTIPFGGLVNYKRLGNGEPDAREVGAAVGANPVSILVPCHRVIRADGTFNGYYWGNKKKAELLTYEANEKSTGN